MRLFLFLIFFCLPALTAALKCFSTDKNAAILCLEGSLCERKNGVADCNRDGNCTVNSPSLTEKCHDNSAMCCCKTNLCNKNATEVAAAEKPAKSTDKDTSTVFIVIIIIIAVSFVLIVVVVAVFLLCCTRRNVAEAKKSEAEPNLISNMEQAPLNDNISSNELAPTPDAGSNQASSAPTGSTNPDINDGWEDAKVEVVDKTETLMRAELTKAQKDEIIRAISTGEGLSMQETTVESLELGRAKIMKIIAYSSSDCITLSERSVRESPVPRKESLTIPQKMLIQLIESGPRQISFETNDMKAVLTEAAEIFRKESSLLEVPLPCVVYGDIHGQYSDLHRWLNANGWPNKKRILFLGDFVDRGSHGVEVVMLICTLKICFPNMVFVCRGNHEEENLNKCYSFYHEVKLRFQHKDMTVYDAFKKCFALLPLAALIGGRILGMHGGISPQLRSLDNIRAIRRPIDEFENGTLACDLVWSDPDTLNNSAEYRPNLDREPNAGIGQLFSKHAVVDACNRLGVDVIIRGHQAPLHGYATWADNRLVTLFSAPGYKGKEQNTVNMGACIVINKHGELTIKQIRVSAEFRRRRIVDTENRRREMEVKKVITPGRVLL